MTIWGLRDIRIKAISWFRIRESAPGSYLSAPSQGSSPAGKAPHTGWTGPLSALCCSFCWNPVLKYKEGWSRQRPLLFGAQRRNAHHRRWRGGDRDEIGRDLKPGPAGYSHALARHAVPFPACPVPGWTDGACFSSVRTHDTTCFTREKQEAGACDRRKLITLKLL